MQSIRTYPEFMTTTCLEWKSLLARESHKEIIIESFRHLTSRQRVLIIGFVLMDNHFHIIWQMLGEEVKSNVQRDFLKYTSQTLLRSIKLNEPSLLGELCVNAQDRKYQIWERNSLSVALTYERFLVQKLNYIHNNPVKAGLCKCPEEYKYSSAGFYICNEKNWDFLSPYKG